MVSNEVTKSGSQAQGGGDRGVHNKLQLHISSADWCSGGMFYFPWNRHQIEGADSL